MSKELELKSGEDSTFLEMIKAHLQILLNLGGIVNLEHHNQASELYTALENNPYISDQNPVISKAEFLLRTYGWRTPEEIQQEYDMFIKPFNMDDYS